MGKLQTDFFIACKKGNMSKILQCIDSVDIHYNDDFALSVAVTSGQMDVVKFLFERGANINCCDGTILDKACKAPKINPDIITYLINNGAPINNRNCDLLYICAKHQNKDIVMYLLHMGLTVTTDQLANLTDDMAQYITQYQNTICRTKRAH